MDIATIKSILHRQLGIKKPVIALQWSKEAPGDIKAYADKNNICYMFRGGTGRAAYVLHDPGRPCVPAWLCSHRT